MTQYIDKSALVAEIERRRRDWRFGSSTEAKFKREECDDILSFLDTLEVKEEPVSKDLDEAARKAGQKYFPDEYNIWARPNYEAVKVEYAFKEGAKWQEEQMIDKACEWLEEHKEHPFIGCEDPCLSGYLTDEFIKDFKQAMNK